MVRLRLENAQMRMERDLLKRLAAFWVKTRGSDPLPVGRCPGGRGVPDQRGARCRWGGPPRLLRLAQQIGRRAEWHRAGVHGNPIRKCHFIWGNIERKKRRYHCC